MDINDRIKYYREMVESYLAGLIPEEDGQLKTIIGSMRYSLFAGGKRLRPVLMLGTGEIYGCHEEDILPFAGSIEMIHTYSLIHDDLPAMDDDDYRRGKPTNHRIYGEGMAVLSGDGLLNLAYETMMGQVLLKKDLKYAAAAYEIARGAGIFGMVGGQAVDIENEGQKVDRETMDFCYKNKTGALITASIRAGAIISGASEGDMDILSEFGRYLGLAFQITDDILDAVGDEAKMGKSTGSDQKDNKPTYVSMYGVESSREVASKLTDDALKQLKYFGNRAEFLTGLTKFLLLREF